MTAHQYCSSLLICCSPLLSVVIMPMTHLPEIGAKNDARTPVPVCNASGMQFGTEFFSGTCPNFVPVGTSFLDRFFGADFWYVCHGYYVDPLSSARSITIRTQHNSTGQHNSDNRLYSYAMKHVVVIVATCCSDHRAVYSVHRLVTQYNGCSATTEIGLKVKR